MIDGINLKNWIEETFRSQGFKKLTQIQSASIPTLLKNKNFIGISATGTGKTLAFLIPIMQKLEFNNKLQSIIIAPTRELARQIYSQIDNFKKFNKDIKSMLLIGGEQIEKQADKLQTLKPEIIVGTVVRLKEIIDKNLINKSSLKSIVLDEADMLIDLGFAKDIDYIFEKITTEDVQKMAWSATLHNLLSQKLSKFFTNSKIVQIGNSIYDNEKINHHIIHYYDKWKVLDVFVKKIKPYLCIIFTNKKENINQIIQYLNSKNIKSLPIHGSLSSRERKNTYKRIKNLETQYVVASDLASRGLDIDGASHIINWDLPDDPEWYVHRAGRCGRSKYSGDSYLFFDGEYEKKLYELQKKGINFDHITLKNDDFKQKDYSLKKPTSNLDENTIEKIKKINNKNVKKVKPNYKKKKAQEIKKLKQKSKRKHIEKKVNEQRIKKYKEQNRGDWND